MQSDSPTLQAAGVEAGQAGNAVQLIVFFGICIGYISTYIFRVANKVAGSASSPSPLHVQDMAYVKQLEDYGRQFCRRRFDTIFSLPQSKYYNEAVMAEHS